MELLMKDDLLFTNNINKKVANKKKSVPINVSVLVYKIDKLYPTSFPNNYIIDFGEYTVKTFTLESLAEIVSIVESKLKKGIQRSLLFFSDSIMVMSDNLTVSMTEYVIYYYKNKYNINIYITYGKLSSAEFKYGLYDESMRVNNGFFMGEAGRGFMRDSFLCKWFINESEITEDEFYCRQDGSNRCKKFVGNGPWDASIAISECTDFLDGAKVEIEAIDAVSNVIGELAPNAIEHGDSNCMIDLCYERSTSLEGQELTDISIVVYNFSEKFLWSDLFEKVFVDNEKITVKKDRLDKVRTAWESHQGHFSKQYTEKDFYNLMAFQKISGRPGDRSDGGLGINTLIQNVQKYSTDDYCYVLSGHGALLMNREITIPDQEDYIAFNKNQLFVEQIPDDFAVMQTKFYMPGVAYNLTFYFEEVH